eukprot:g2421.t1
MQETFAAISKGQIQQIYSDPKILKKASISMNRLSGHIFEELKRNFKMVGSDAAEPISEELLNRETELNEKLDVFAEKIRHLRESGPQEIEKLIAKYAEESMEGALKVRPAEENKEEQLRATKRRRKLENCISELTEMIGQIRENANIVSESTTKTLKDCKDTSEAVSEFCRQGARALPSTAATKASALQDAATPKRTAATKVGKENL